ncbi:hypothetical protein BU23DRAFT_604196 [Bimuria novae-zelandiae CBS 107.79]|uniref:Uncharacterized protein n=1 Tax=Bimuria novae-zelandiae CBS 107.79 TaxID=1447943 RepID=A0A6A5UKF1_9PLEO|nr:hypothetical protein BU23DRAFT_604196 [Bimuria novae-zelandiae CBS 107.79]
MAQPGPSEKAKNNGDPEKGKDSGISESRRIPLQQALGAGLVQKFEILGIANLLFLETKIQLAKDDLMDRIKANHIPKNKTEIAANDDSRILDLVLELTSQSHPDSKAKVGTETTTGGNENLVGSESLRPALQSLMSEVQVYNKAILQQRKILSLPAYDIIDPEANNDKIFRYFDEKSLPKRFKYANGARFNKFQVVHKSSSATGDYISLDPCTCSEVCPTGFAGLANLGSWTQANVPENVITLLRLVLLSMIPSGTIIALYAVPSVWGRLGFIVGESAIVIAVLARKLADGNVLAYMIGIKTHAYEFLWLSSHMPGANIRPVNILVLVI